MINPVTNFYYSKKLPENAVGLMHVRSTPITPADYTDKLNLYPVTGQLGPGALGARAWPVEAHVFPAVPLGSILALNDNPGVTGQSFMYTVENQFVEVTNKWDSNGTYFYFHNIPNGVTISQILDEEKKPVTAAFLVEGAKLYHSLKGTFWVRYYSEEQFHDELLTSMLVMPRGPRLNKEDGPFVAPDHFAWTHGVIDLPPISAANDSHFH
jgi:hypothetical protein